MTISRLPKLGLGSFKEVGNFLGVGDIRLNSDGIDAKIRGLAATPSAAEREDTQLITTWLPKGLNAT